MRIFWINVGFCCYCKYLLDVMPHDEASGRFEIFYCNINSRHHVLQSVAVNFTILVLIQKDSYGKIIGFWCLMCYNHCENHENAKLETSPLAHRAEGPVVEIMARVWRRYHMIHLIPLSMIEILKSQFSIENCSQNFPECEVCKRPLLSVCVCLATEGSTLQPTTGRISSPCELKRWRVQQCMVGLNQPPMKAST